MTGKIGAYDYPSNNPVVDTNTGMATDVWQYTFSRWNNVIVTLQQTGTTAQRPTGNLWIGRVFFDTTLGKPIWLKGVRPTVWVDATGAAV